MKSKEEKCIKPTKKLTPNHYINITLSFISFNQNKTKQNKTNKTKIRN